MTKQKQGKQPLTLEKQLNDLLQLDRPLKLSRSQQIETVLDQFPDGDALVATLRKQLAQHPVDVTSIQAAISGNEALTQRIESTLDAIPEREELLFELSEFLNEGRRSTIARLNDLGSRVSEMAVRLRVRPMENGMWQGFAHFDFLAEGGRGWGSQTRKAFTTTDLPILLLGMACLYSSSDELVEYQLDKTPRAKNVPLQKYHPERFRGSRAYAKSLEAITRLHNASAAVTERHFRTTQEALFKDVQDRSMEFTIEQREAKGHSAMRSLNAEVNLLTKYLMYKGAGKEIFDFPHKLADMLANSDADDLRLEQIRLPYSVQYIHFGKRKDLPLAPGWYCDGAYVSASDHYLTVTVTASPDDMGDLDLWPVQEEPTYTFHFQPEDRGTDLGTAVDLVVSRELAKLDEEIRDTPRRQEEANAAVRTLGLPEGSVHVSTTERANAQRSDALSRKDVAHQALSLVVNALCYLTAYPDDIDHQWPGAAPTGLVFDSENGATPGARKRASQQLHSEGFSKIRLCGAKFREEAQDLPTGEGLGGSVRAHWRRGHWRNQVHGAGRQLRRLVWIMPVIVNAGGLSPDSELAGHVYKPDLPEYD